MTKRGKVVALSTAGLGVVVLVAAGITAWPRVREEYYLHKLESGDRKEQVAAIRVLMESPSEKTRDRATRALFESSVGLSSLGEDSNQGR